MLVFGLEECIRNRSNSMCRSRTYSATGKPELPTSTPSAFSKTYSIVFKAIRR